MAIYGWHRAIKTRKAAELQRLLYSMEQYCHDKWWRRGDLNPRPRTRNFRYYMFRLVFNLMGVQPTARQPAHDSAKFDCLAADALNSGSVKMPLNLNVQTHSSERQRELSR